jgi:hypothetical protein
MRAIARKLSQQILELDLGSLLGAEAREAIAPAAGAVTARHAHDDVRVEGEPIARHRAHVAGGANRERRKRMRRLAGDKAPGAVNLGVG